MVCVCIYIYMCMYVCVRGPSHSFYEPRLCHWLMARKKSNAEPQTVEITFKAFDYIYVPLACTWNQNDGYMIFMGKWEAFLNQGWGCFPLNAKLLALFFHYYLFVKESTQTSPVIYHTTSYLTWIFEC